jgi:hypothetical protein
MKSKRWRELTKKAFAAAEALAFESANKQLPVRLSQVAASRLVKDVIFRPLLVDGCLGIKKDGFVIFVRADKDRTDDLQKAWRFEGQANFRLPARTRFTIAHEIAHTFFFEEKSVRPRADINLEVPQTVKGLEYACNEVAVRLLLPDKLLLPQIKKLNILDPHSLRDLARRAGVATQILTVRLKQCVDWSGQPGAVLCVRKGPDGTRVIARAMHYSLRPYLRSDREETPLRELLADASFLLNGGDCPEVTFPFRCFVGKQPAIQYFVWRCEDVAPLDGGRYFVTIKRKGDLQLLNSAAA